MSDKKKLMKLGEIIDVDINECDSNPCLNGGSSVDLVNEYNCICPPGYNGSRCGNDSKSQLQGYKMFRYLLLFCLQLGLLLGDELGNASIKPRAKRASYHHSHSSKHLLYEIIDEQHDLDKTKESIYILERDHCTNIKSVGKPVTHNARHHYQGAWMKDPLGIMGTETIFVMKSWKLQNVVEEFENMDMFKAGVTRKKYTLPYNWDGTGGVVYGPYLYFNRANSPYIVKYNLKTERVEAQISVSGYTTGKNHYAWNGNSGMDLAVDEQGLWVLWGSTGNSRRLYAYKIDVVGNSVTHTYTLSTEPMSSMGNAFVACGVIYCIDSHSDRSTTINFAYDTKTGNQWNPNIQFTNQYTFNTMVDYNPRERVLYAWDHRRQVTYQLTFEEH
ncbi:Olfactomedin-like protein 2A [Desmophyllum pertusum]|uniref:Olfactomedin-like protein 2A n=1 Tax=Desmophyllum pertusum TaxID=174260 RepID=A0A9W9YTJ6_9CNID|nr:Olfactomedin-like protein 2A [Desmophyllum pertusum]